MATLAVVRDHPSAQFSPEVASEGQGHECPTTQCTIQHPYPSLSLSPSSSKQFPLSNHMQAILDSPLVFDVSLHQHAPPTPPPSVHTLPAQLPLDSPLTALELGSNIAEAYSYLAQPWPAQPRWLSDLELDMDVLEAPARTNSALMGLGHIDPDGWYTPPSLSWEEADRQWHSNGASAPHYTPLSPLSPLDDIPQQYSHNTHLCSPPPSYNVPSLPTGYLRSPFLGSTPDLDDDLGFDFESPPSSPSSLHSTSSLPDDEDGMDFTCAMDTDSSYDSYCPTNLLLIDEEDAPSSPSSIASSSLEFEAELESSLDPTVIQLCAIRNRAMLAERAARHAESVSVGCAAAEAKRIRKSEKAKGKEVSTLLRLKLYEEMVSSSPGYEDEPLPPCGDLPARGEALSCRTKKGEMTSIAELVAKMLLRRHEVVRPLTNRARPVSHKTPRTPSSLSISVD